MSGRRLAGTVLLLAALTGAALAQDAGLPSADNSYVDLLGRLREGEALLQEGRTVTEADIRSIEGLDAEIAASGYARLLDRSRTLLALAGEKRRLQESADRASVVPMLEAAERAARQARRLRAGRRLSLGVALVSLGLANTFWYLSDAAYDEYIDSGARDRQLKDRITIFDTMTIASGSVALASLGVSIVLFASQPRGPDWP